LQLKKIVEVVSGKSDFKTTIGNFFMILYGVVGGDMFLVIIFFTLFFFSILYTYFFFQFLYNNVINSEYEHFI